VPLFGSHQLQEEKLITSLLKISHITRNLKGLDLSIDNSKDCGSDGFFLDHKQHFGKQTS